MLLEVNESLFKFIPDKIWNADNAKTMEFYQKVEFANPSPLMQE
jgi:hypothetical protein